MSLLGVEWMISKEYLSNLMPQLEIKEMTRHQPRNVDIFLRIMLKVHAHLYVYAFGVKDFLGQNQIYCGTYCYFY
jgi:hypothetical protein